MLKCARKNFDFFLRRHLLITAIREAYCLQDAFTVIGDAWRCPTSWYDDVTQLPWRTRQNSIRHGVMRFFGMTSWERKYSSFVSEIRKGSKWVEVWFFVKDPECLFIHIFTNDKYRALFCTNSSIDWLVISVIYRTIYTVDDATQKLCTGHHWQLWRHQRPLRNSKTEFESSRLVEWNRRWLNEV